MTGKGSPGEAVLSIYSSECASKQMRGSDKRKWPQILHLALDMAASPANKVNSAGLIESRF